MRRALRGAGRGATASERASTEHLSSLSVPTDSFGERYSSTGPYQKDLPNAKLLLAAASALALARSPAAPPPDPATSAAAQASP